MKETVRLQGCRAKRKTKINKSISKILLLVELSESRCNPVNFRPWSNVIFFTYWEKWAMPVKNYLALKSTLNDSCIIEITLVWSRLFLIIPSSFKDLLRSIEGLKYISLLPSSCLFFGSAFPSVLRTITYSAHLCTVSMCEQGGTTWISVARYRFLRLSKV